MPDARRPSRVCACGELETKSARGGDGDGAVSPPGTQRSRHENLRDSRECHLTGCAHRVAYLHISMRLGEGGGPLPPGVRRREIETAIRRRETFVDGDVLPRRARVRQSPDRRRCRPRAPRRRGAVRDGRRGDGKREMVRGGGAHSRIRGTEQGRDPRPRGPRRPRHVERFLQPRVFHALARDVRARRRRAARGAVRPRGG